MVEHVNTAVIINTVLEDLSIENYSIHCPRSETDIECDDDYKDNSQRYDLRKDVKENAILAKRLFTTSVQIGVVVD